MSETKALSTELIDRFSRQLILPRWTMSYQNRIINSRLLVAAEFSSAILYAAAGGISRLYISGDLDPSLANHLPSFYSDIEVFSADDFLKLPICDNSTACLAILPSQISSTVCKDEAKTSGLIRYELSEHELLWQNKPILNISDFPMSNCATSWYEYASTLAVAHHLGTTV